MRTERRSRAARGALLVAALAVAAGVWTWWPAPTPLPPPSPAPALHTNPAELTEVAARGTGTVAPAPGAGAGAQPARAEVAPPRTAVVGTALDVNGGPLAGFSVLLQRTDEKPALAPPPPVRPTGPGPEWMTEQGISFGHVAELRTVDAAGAFAFEGLEAGSYKCHVVGLESYAETFALAVGEVHELTLRSPMVALVGTLYRCGAVARDCFVVFEDGATRRAGPQPDDDGIVRTFAAPGRYEVLVHARARSSRPDKGWGPCLSRHVLLVPEGAAVVRWRFETGGTELTVRVHDAAGKAIEVFTLELVGTAACDQLAARYFIASERGRGAVLPLVAAGQWRVAVNGANMIVAPRDLTVDDSLPRHELAFVAEPAVTVKLVLRPRDGLTFSPSMSLLPPLRAAGREVKCSSPTTRPSPAVRRGDFLADYANVPFGTAELRFEDRVEGDEQLMLPFEPLPPVRVDVTADGSNEIVLTVEPRVPVDLRGCDQRGMEDLQAVVSVWADGRSVRGQDAGSPQRWQGWLPRGTYRVVVERSTGVPFPAGAGSRREHSLRVERDPVRQRYRP